MTSRADSLTFEDLQKAKESAEKDIVNQLKKRRAFKLHHGVGDTLLYSIDETQGDPTCEEAAAEITSLRKHIEDLDDLQTILDEQLDKYTAALAEAREIMKPFNGALHKHQLDSAQVYITSFDQDGEEWEHGSCRVGDLRRLAQWLERNP